VGGVRLGEAAFELRTPAVRDAVGLVGGRRAGGGRDVGPEEIDLLAQAAVAVAKTRLWSGRPRRGQRSTPNTSATAQPSTVSSSRAQGSTPCGSPMATLSSAEPVMPTTARP